jgi:hypothetical protein
MRVHPKEWHRNTWQNIASRIYQASLCMYPKSFFDRFGSEMNEVFKEALDEHAQKGLLYTLLFIVRELIETPISILNQHLSVKSFRVQPFSINIMAFTFGFALLGLIEILKNSLNFIWIQGGLINFLILTFIGGLFSLAIGTILDPRRKYLFALCGAFGFFLANTLVKQVYFWVFPDAFSAPGIGVNLLIPFLSPILTGSVFGFFIGVASGNSHGLLRWTSLGSLALLTGFFVNCFSAALMQSFLFHSPYQDIAHIGIGGLIIPYLLEGILLGILLGGITQRRISVNQ